MDRRVWMKRAVHGVGGVIAGIVLVPAVIMGLSPALEHRRTRPESWRTLGALDDFPIGEVHEAIIHIERGDRARSGGGLERKGVYVWRVSAAEAVVFARNCTDVSCPVTYDRGSGWFMCPCHGGKFDREGMPVAGPPSRPLFRFASRVRDGVLEIDVNSVPPMV